MSDADYNGGDDENYHGVAKDGSDDKVAEAAQWLRDEFEKPARSDSKKGEEKQSPSFAIDPRALDAVAKLFRSLGEKFLEESIAFHVLDDRIRFTVCYRRTIVTAEARLLKPAGAAAKSRFGLKVFHLIGLAKHFHDDLTCELSADSSYLEVTSGMTKLSLPTMPIPTNTEIVPISSASPDPRLGHVDARLLRRGLAFVGRASRTDKKSSAMSTVEIEDGVGRGGTLNALVVFEAVRLAGLNLKLTAADLAGTCSLLNAFDRAYFSETTDSYVFKDSHIAMSIQKAPGTFPPVKQLLEVASDEKLSVRVGQFADALYCFEPLTVGRRTEVTLELVRDDDHLSLKAMIPSKPRNNGNSRIPIDFSDAHSNEPSAGTKVKVDLRALIKLMTFNGDPDRSLQIAMFPRQLMVADEVDGIKTRAIFARLK